MLSWSSPTMFAPFGASTPITRNGMFLMRTVCPIGSVVWKSLPISVWPITQTLFALWTSRSAKNSPVCNRPVADSQIIAVDPVDLLRAVVRAAENHLRGRPDEGGRGEHRRAILRDRIGVASREGDLGLHHAATSANRGLDDDDVGPQRGKLTLHQEAGALAHRNHRRDGGNADHHAEHGQSGSHLVLGERSKSNAYCDGGNHGVSGQEAYQTELVAGAGHRSQGHRRF